MSDINNLEEQNINNWEEQKNTYIRKLKNCNNVINKVFNITTVGNIDSIIDNETRSKLKDLLQNSIAFIDKLSKGTFEVAMIGLENAGKSSFGNALVKNKVLPTDTSRCTYTSTQLEYGEKNLVQIEFYTKEEFEDSFRKLLKNSGIKEYDSSVNSFENITQDILLQLKNKNENENNIYVDIEQIIEGRNVIKTLLGKGTEDIELDQEKDKDKYKLYITDKYKSKAVKRIVIKSKELSETKEIKIYDVPGFDAPVKLFENQTIDRIKNADAIILIMNLFDKPELTKEPIKILSDVKDKDGIPLIDKLFIFGNKVDLFGENREGALKNIAVLKKDVIDVHKMAKSQRIFIGSAQAYLDYFDFSEGKIDEDNLLTVKSLKSLGMTDGINEIKEEIKNYCNTERFWILKNRIDKNLQNTKELFNKIIQQNNVGDEVFDKEEQLIRDRCKDKIDKNIESALLKAQDDLKEKIYKDNSFTENFKNLVDNIFEPVTEEFINKQAIQEKRTATREIPIGRFNYSIRTKLYGKVKEKFTQIIRNLGGKVANDCNVYILEKFLESMGVSKGNRYYDTIRKSAEEFISTATASVSYDEKFYMSSVQKSSMDLIDILIYYPLGSVDRKNKFKASEQEFYDLAMYYDKNEQGKPSYMQPLISIILAQQGVSDKSVQNKVISNKIFSEALLDVVKQYPEIYKIYEDEKWLEEFDRFYKDQIQDQEWQKNLDMDIIKKEFALKIEELETSDKNTLRNIGLTYIKGKLKSIIRQFSNNTEVALEVALDDASNSNDKEKYIEKLLSKAKLSESVEELVLEINRDGQFLIELLKNATLNAVSLEKSFLNIINEQINLIISKAGKGVDKNKSDEYINFINENIDKIYYDKLEDIKRRRDTSEARRKIAKQLNEILNELEGE